MMLRVLIFASLLCVLLLSCRAAGRTPLDGSCPGIYQPVCANGQTYSNSCEAQRVGQTQFTQGECQVSNPGGVACPDIYAPVCGANGQTYSNSCAAQQAGQFQYTQGECGVSIGPIMPG